MFNKFQFYKKNIGFPTSLSACKSTPRLLLKKYLDYLNGGNIGVYSLCKNTYNNLIISVK